MTVRIKDLGETLELSSIRNVKMFKNKNANTLQIEHYSKKMTINVTDGYVYYYDAKNTPRVMKLGRREASILRYFIEHENEVISKEELLEYAWTESVVCENSVVVAISNLRQLFRKVDKSCACIKTISGQGYIFVASLSGFSEIISGAHYAHQN